VIGFLKERSKKFEFFEFINKMAWEKAIQLAEENSEILKDEDVRFNYAWALVEIGEFSQAKRILEEMKEEMDYSPVYWILLARIYLEEENEAGFWESVSNAERIDPTHPVLRFLIGKYYARHGQIERAAAEFEFFTSEYAGYKDALVLAVLESVMRDFEYLRNFIDEVKNRDKVNAE